MKVASKSTRSTQTSNSKMVGKASVQAMKATGAVGRLRTHQQFAAATGATLLASKRAADAKRNELVINSVKQGLKEVELIEKGEIKPKSIDQLLNEL